MPVKAVSEVDGHGIQKNATQPAFRMLGGLLHQWHENRLCGK